LTVSSIQCTISEVNASSVYRTERWDHEVTIYLTKAVPKGHKIAWFMLQAAPAGGPDQPLARPVRPGPAAVVAPVRHRPPAPRLKPTRARVAKASARR
jgi:hypothetical protein